MKNSEILTLLPTFFSGVEFQILCLMNKQCFIYQPTSKHEHTKWRDYE